MITLFFRLAFCNINRSIYSRKFTREVRRADYKLRQSKWKDIKNKQSTGLFRYRERCTVGDAMSDIQSVVSQIREMSDNLLIL